jgi:hydrogenase/urease accessory protein HupE
MRQYAMFILVSLLLTAVPASAHDLGISQTRLSEIAPGSYRLSVLAESATTRLFAAPQLPGQCEFSGSTPGVQGTQWKTFEFSCGTGLLPGDSLLLPWTRDGVMMTATWADGSKVSRLFKSESGMIEVRLVDLSVGSGSVAAAAKRYTTLGIGHILEGYDHLLFIFALLLVVSNAWMLVKTVTAFTLAHSITLAMATLGLVNLPPRPVEAAIALSIVFLAVEIMRARSGRLGLTYRSPWVIAFAFGLLHGFGFAGALAEIGLPQAEIPIALLFFNLGVEIGQLMFVLVVVALGWTVARLRFALPEIAGVLPAYTIGTVAMYWLMERVTSIVTPTVEILLRAS